MLGRSVPESTLCLGAGSALESLRTAFPHLQITSGAGSSWEHVGHLSPHRSHPDSCNVLSAGAASEAGAEVLISTEGS